MKEFGNFKDRARRRLLSASHTRPQQRDVLPQMQAFDSSVARISPGIKMTGDDNFDLLTVDGLVPQQLHISYELLLILGLVSSLLIGRNMSRDEMIAFLLRCQQDRLLPLVTFVLGIGLYRYIVTRFPLRSPTSSDEYTVL